MNCPRVSILLPAYNAERYLREAIDSMLSQTYQNFELLIIDDGSKDRTAEIVRSYTDERIRFIQNECNIGLANTLNKGMRLARGEYLARMDADDISLPTRLEIQVRYLDEHPDVMLCSCALQQFGASDKQMIGREDFEFVKAEMLFSSAIGHASSVWRKAFFVENHLMFMQDEFPAEDYGLWTRAVFYGKMVNIPDLLYRYRIYPEQVTATDMRSAEKCRQIRQKYIARLCPYVSKEYIDAFISMDDGISTYSQWRKCVAFVRYMVRHTTSIAKPCLHRLLFGYLAQRARRDARNLPNIYQRAMVRLEGCYFRLIKYFVIMS